MKKRGTISRCCCGDGGGTGPCLDACEDNYNSCTPSNVGQVYETDTAARANCGWLEHNPGGITASNPGVDGNFLIVGLSTRASLSKSFAFDYRTNPGVDLSVDIVADTDGGTSSVAVEVWQTSVITSSQGIVATAGESSVILPSTSSWRTIRIVNEIGDSVRTVSHPDGYCIETVRVDASIYVAGTLVAQGTYDLDFIGKTCFTQVLFNMRATGSLFFAGFASTRNCSIAYA